MCITLNHDYKEADYCSFNILSTFLPVIPQLSGCKAWRAVEDEFRVISFLGEEVVRRKALHTQAHAETENDLGSGERFHGYVGSKSMSCVLGIQPHVHCTCYEIEAKVRVRENGTLLTLHCSVDDGHVATCQGVEQ